MLDVRKWPFSIKIETDGLLFDLQLPKVPVNDVLTIGLKNHKYIQMANPTLSSNARKASAMVISVTNRIIFSYQSCFLWLPWFYNRINSVWTLKSYRSANYNQIMLRKNFSIRVMFTSKKSLLYMNQTILLNIYFFEIRKTVR